MNTPVQIGLPQVVIILIAIIGVGLLITSLMGIFRGQREVEIFEDEDGYRYRRWRQRRRRLRWKSGLSGIIMLVAAVFLLWLTFAVQAYLGLTSDIKVAHVHATKVENGDTNSPLISVELTTYDQNGQQVSDKTYILKGDRWLLQGNIIKFPTWMNIFGIHSGYKLTRLEGQYDDPNVESEAKHTVIVLNGGDGDFFKTVYKQAWSSQFVEAAYGNAVIVPADGMSYNIYVSQSGLYAKPDK